MKDESSGEGPSLYLGKSLFLVILPILVLIAVIIRADPLPRIILNHRAAVFFIVVLFGLISNYLFHICYYYFYFLPSGIPPSASYYESITTVGKLVTNLGKILIVYAPLTAILSIIPAGIFAILIGWPIIQLFDVPRLTIFLSLAWMICIIMGYSVGYEIFSRSSFAELNEYIDRFQKVKYHKGKVERAMERGKSRLTSGSPQSALKAFKTASREIDKTRAVSNEIDYSDEEIEEYHSKVAQEIKGIESTLLPDKIEEIKSKLDRAEEQINREDYHKSNELLDDSESYLDSIRNKIDNHGLEQFEDELASLNERYEKLREEVKRKLRKRSIADEVSEIRLEIKQASTLLEDGEIETAQDIIEGTESEIVSARETAAQYNFDDLQSEIDQLDQRRRDQLEEAEKLQREQRRQQLRDEVDTLRTDVGQAETLANQKEFKKARTTLEELASGIESAKETALEYDFQELHEDLTALERRRESRLEDVTERLETNPVPDTIPRAPNISVEYDALTDREVIGGGGNADVTKATLPTPDGTVTLAIKEPRMAGTLHTDIVERMLEEAETWDKLDDHDHIVGVIDYGSAPIPWIAMEYMDGGHLGDRSGELEIPQALWTALSITKGVRHAHRRGVAHLDLKPENVLFRSVEEKWDVPKVADWGLSKHLLEHSKSVEGMSVEYAAPEQFDEDYGPTDDITDVYQLGAVFYELFTGRPPFEGQPFKVIDMVKTDKPTPPSEMADVPSGLDEVLLTALAKEKADRYEDIVYLRDDLRELFDEW